MSKNKNKTNKQHKNVENKAYHQAMVELRRSGATTPVPFPWERGTRKSRKKESIKDSMES